MSKIDRLFAELKSAGRKAFIPFVSAGDPDLEFTAAVVRELAARGSSLAEIGIPYSDPIADGPVIQASYTRALAKHIKVADIFSAVRALARDVAMPLVTMVSYAIVHRHGAERFVAEAVEAGFAGAIVPDLPVDESQALSKICRREDFSLIQLITPTTPRSRAVRIAASSTGFIYYVSVTGITGERTTLPPDLVENVAWLRTQTTLPICIGFGISRAEHVRTLAPVADGLIVGSAIVRKFTENPQRTPDETVADIGNLAATLIAALSQA